MKIKHLLTPKRETYCAFWRYFKGYESESVNAESELHEGEQLCAKCAAEKQKRG